jgi:hypothetical protein
MFWFGGVWDPRMKHRVIGFAGIMAVFLIAYFAALANGTQFIRLIF